MLVEMAKFFVTLYPLKTGEYLVESMGEEEDFAEQEHLTF